MKLIIGLGNPGEKYKNNRHNVGYIFIDQAKKIKNFTLVKTNVFMNDSGSAVKKLVEHFSLDLHDLYIVHDDLDIKLGEYKIQFGKGPKDHKGLNSVSAALGSDQFWHVRVGVDSRKPDKRTAGEKFVLEDFTNDERRIIDGVINRICRKLATF